MTRRRLRIWATLCSATGVLALALPLWMDPHPRFLWNASASVPIGLYRLTPDSHPARGALVVILPPPALGRFMAERHYLPLGLPMVKQLAARAGDKVCRHGAVVTVNGVPRAVARLTDTQGRTLPVWRGCRIVQSDEFFLLTAAPDSLDSRYFGPVPAAGLRGRATALLTRDAPNAPLQWRLRCIRDVLSPPGQGELSCK